MRFYANSVAASAEGDYYQLWLDVTDSQVDQTDPREPTGPYLIVQRDFETPDRGWCYIETHDAGYVGHFRLRLTELSRTCLAFEIVRARNNHVEVSFSISASEFEEVRRIAEVIFSERGPGLDDEAF
jgi:hypothetical protein